MAPESPAPTPSSPHLPNPNFPLLSVSLSRKLGRRSDSRIPVARVSPGNLDSLLLATLSSSLVEHSKPPRHSPPPSSSSAFASPLLPSSLSAHVSSILDVDSPAPNPSGPCSPFGAAFASGSGVRPFGLCSPPSLDVSCVSVEVPCLAGADIVDDLGTLDVEDSGLPVGTQTWAIPRNRSPPEQDGSPAAKDAIMSVQMGSLVSFIMHSLGNLLHSLTWTIRSLSTLDVVYCQLGSFPILVCGWFGAWLTWPVCH